MEKKYAPIVIFIYNRPDHLKKTLESIKLCKEYKDSPVIIYADGAKTDEDWDSVNKTRNIAQEILGDNAKYFFSKANKGLSNSIIKGVTDTIKHYKKVIVLEDDLIVAPNFLTYMNEALTKYNYDKEVYQVSGYQFGTLELTDKNCALFLPITVSWGWATWERAWLDFDPKAAGWEQVISDRVLRKRFNLDGVYDYSNMLVRQMIGLRDSWAIRWYWTVFNKKGIVIFPPYSLVKNTGFDGSGTHGKGLLRKYDFQQNILNNTEFKLPDSIEFTDNNYTLAKQSITILNGRWYGIIIDKIRWFVTILKKWQYY